MAPFRAMSASHLSRPMKGAGRNSFTPSLDAFKGIQSVKDFRMVKGGKEGEGNATASRFPNCFLLHPGIFIYHVVGQVIDAAELAVELIEELKDAFGKDEDWTRDKPLKNLVEVHELLCFL